MGKITDQTLSGPFIIIHRMGAPAVFKFPMAPQSVHVSLPPRVSVDQTLAANWLNDYSGPRSILTHVQLAGTFGYRTTVGGIGAPMPGSMHLLTFEKLVEAYNGLSRQVKRDLGAVQEYVSIPRLYFWRIVITKFDWHQDKERPLLYFYDMTFLRLQDYLSVTSPSLPPGLPGISSGASLGGLF